MDSRNVLAGLPRPAPSTEQAFFDEFRDKRPGFRFVFQGDMPSILGSVLRVGRYALIIKTTPDMSAPVGSVRRQVRVMLVFKHALAMVEPIDQGE